MDNQENIHMKTYNTACTLIACMMFGAATAVAAPPAKAPAVKAPADAAPESPFDALCKKLQHAGDSATETEINQLLTESRRLGRHFEIAGILKNYLARNPSPSASMLALAADNAWLTGDYRTAANRCKGYLKSTEPNAESSEIAARLYTIQLDFLADRDDAYNSMREIGDRFRQSPAARRHDTWFLGEARDRKDLASLLRRVDAAMADNLPLPHEQLYYWEHMDMAFTGIENAKPSSELFHAARSVAARVRDPRRQALYTFLAAAAEFKAASAVKASGADFGPVAAAAAKAFESDPTANTLQRIVVAFFGGDGDFNERNWQVQEAAKRAFFVSAFDKLQDTDREKMLQWRPRNHAYVRNAASPQQWAERVTKYPAIFTRGQNLRDIPLTVDDAAAATKLAAALNHAPSVDGAIISAAAAPTLAECLATFIRDESWHLPADQVHGLIWQRLIPVYQSLHKDQSAQLTDNACRAAFFQVGGEYLAKTPWPLFDPQAAKNWLDCGWTAGTTNDLDRAYMTNALASLAWIPLAQRERRDAFEGPYRNFQNWAAGVRRSNDPNAAAAKQAAAAIEQAFQVLLNTPAGAEAMAPTPVCRAASQVTAARRARNASQTQALNTSATELYALIRNYETQHVPFGSTLLALAVRGQESMDNTQSQCAILDGILASYDPDRPSHAWRTAVPLLAQGRWSWMGDIPKQNRDAAQKFNDVFSKALLGLIEKNQFSGELFDLVRATRRGNGWSDSECNENLVEAMISRKSLQTAAWRPQPDIRSATCAYQWLINYEFPRLGAKYPVDEYFDDMFVEEATRTGYLDSMYWPFGKDRRKKIVNAAATVLQKFDTVPFGFDPALPVYARHHFWDWLDRAAGADKTQRDALLARLDGSFGKTRFDEFAAGRLAVVVAASDPAITKQDLFARLGAYVERAQNIPARLSPPRLPSLPRIVKPDGLTDTEIAAIHSLIVRLTPPSWPRDSGYEDAAVILDATFSARKRQAELPALAAHFWKLARDTSNSHFQRHLIGRSETAMKAGDFNLAAAYATSGIEILGANLPEDTRAQLMAVRTQALLSFGSVLPVDRSDPRYPVFAAQASFQAGNEDEAWNAYASATTRAGGMFKELDPAFVVWLINRSARAQNFTEAEAIARQMLLWIEGAGANVEAETRARILLAYANISLERREYAKARALYERIVAAQELEATRAREQAELRIADVDRLTKQYDKAAELLDRLTRRRDRVTQTEAYMQMALLKFDQEDYPEARKALDQVFLRHPGHPEGRIMEGKLDLKMKRLVEATEVKVGLSSAQRLIVPGRPLKIRLEDQNLAIVGKADNIEIRTWTDSGDDEVFSLVPFGDSKTKFEGTLNTALAPTVKGDRVLQILGEDTVRYDFSDRFKRAHNITSEPLVLTIASDSELYISSGRILSREEIAQRQLEDMLRLKLQIKEQQPGEAVALSLVRPPDQVKPGNRINVRVEDHDRSISAGKDKLPVRVESTSGDAIAAFDLVETETHSGVFEGSVPTVPAQATASASDSTEGLQPVFAISGGTHPAWVAAPNNQRPKLFTIDLNDNVALGELKIQASEPGRKLKSFSVQTSLNHREYRTAASWPQTVKPWEGELRLIVARADPKAMPSSIDDFQNWLNTGTCEKGQKPLVAPVKSLLLNMDSSVMGLADPLRLADADSYVAHLQGAFYLPTRMTRTFRFVGEGSAQTSRFIFSIDGEVAVAPAAAGRNSTAVPPEIRKSFSKGVHRLDVFIVTQRKAGAKIDIQVDTDKPPFMATCPYEMFDVSVQADIKKEVFVPPATVAPDADQKTFTCSFPSNQYARIIRFLFEDFESDAPAVTKVLLTAAGGKQVLPTQQDLTQLKNNRILEIVPGDRITISYEDPKGVTQAKPEHKASLTATYSNGRITASFAEFDPVRGEAQRTARYVPIRRFIPGDAVTVIIQDPDADTSPKPDKVKFTAKTTGGEPVTVEALETDEHSGVFSGNIFPVKGAPQRATELKVGEADDITLAYMDQENTDPGVPWIRRTTIEQAVYVEPQFRAYETTSRSLTEATDDKARPGAGRGKTASRTDDSDEVYLAARSILVQRPEKAEQVVPARSLMDGPAMVELLFPTIALSPASQAAIYVQTTSGRKLYGKPPAEPYDINVPGTLKLKTSPGDVRGARPPPGYREVIVRGDMSAGSALDDGRFMFNIPMKLGDVPKTSAALAEEIPVPGAEAPSVMIRGGDELFIGFTYKDKAGAPQWITRRIALGSDVFLDVMDRRYQEPVEGLHVGESVYFRVIDKARHVTAEKDTVVVEIKTSSGQAKELRLLETFGDTGVFKGFATLVHAQDQATTLEASAMPVNYGDTVTISYRGTVSNDVVQRAVTVYKGADGLVLPFTKRFKDPEIAVQTQFTVAEAYFELAKKHRELGEEEQARRGIAQGKKMLEEAVRDNPETKARAQADYLLANLSLEFANIATNTTEKRKYHMEAIGRFTDLVATYPDSVYAPKAQFKKALTFEMMGEIDQSCEEYVKLSYRYPDNELVAETIARLGNYFFAKGKALNDKAEAAAQPLEKEKIRIESRHMFKTAAEVFGRLSARFPSHQLAWRSIVLSAQCYMRADENAKAVEVFKRITEDTNADKDVRAEGMYWCGDACIRLRNFTEAYRMFTRLKWDYPETKWAKFARGRLTEPALAQIAKADGEQ